MQALAGYIASYQLALVVKADDARGEKIAQGVWK
jgi:hypothetical protein